MDHIGIDVHKRESQIYILAEGGEVVEQRIRTEPERFARLHLGSGLLGVRGLLSLSPCLARRVSDRLGQPPPSLLGSRCTLRPL